VTASGILVAGIGNIFLGDDGFGVEVAQRLARRTLPEAVCVADFGIRGFDLAYALLEDYAAVILVDALPRGGDPGTLYVLEPALDDLDEPAADQMETHTMNPLNVLHLVRSMGGRPRRVLVVGCEPASVALDEEGQIGLSAPVQAAVDGAVELVESLVTRMLA